MTVEDERALFPPYITFRCDIEGCNNLSTRKRSHYLRSRHHYCSPECQKKGRKENTKRINLRCSACSKPFTRRRSEIRKGSQNAYCNRECYEKWRASKRMTREEVNARRNHRRWLRYQSDSAYREHCRSQRLRNKRKARKKAQKG